MFRSLLCSVFSMISMCIGVPDWRTVGNLNCFMESQPYDRGAEVNLNNGDALTLDWENCVDRCAQQYGSEFLDCEYVVYHEADQLCYPRKGLQCAKCDYNTEYSLVAPWSMQVDDCPGPSPPPSPSPAWSEIPSVNCYMESYPYDHGAKENLANGDSVNVKDKADCMNRCATRDGWQFTGCQYVVYEEEGQKCYPRNGLQCANCKYDTAYTMLVPDDLRDETRNCPSSQLKTAVSVSDWRTVGNLNCYMEYQPYDHGAEVNLNNGQPLTLDWGNCVDRCAQQDGSEFLGCEYVVYHEADQLCYPRKGLQCAKCDYNTEYSLVAPWSMQVDDCSGPSPPPSPSPAWSETPSVNCYMEFHPYDHGAKENLGKGDPVIVKDKADCMNRCVTQDGWPFTGCQYAVYEVEGQKCYPRNGLQCANCKYDTAYTMLVPDDLRDKTSDCPVRPSKKFLDRTQR